MVTADTVNGYMHRLCNELGVETEKVYNSGTGAWYFSLGDSTIEVFLTTQNNLQHHPQTFIRCMAPLCEIPRDIMKQFRLYQTALAINATYLGYKISAEEDRGLVCAIAERNIEGMDYDEMTTLINDLGHWADKLDHFMKAEFHSK